MPIICKDMMKFMIFSLAWWGYVFFSYPFPKSITSVEGVIGGLLILLGGSKAVTLSFSGWYSEGALRNSLASGIGYIVLQYMLIVPLVMGLIKGWNVSDIIRDVVPVLYFSISLLVFPGLISAERLWGKCLPWFLALGGCVISVRYFIETSTAPWDMYGVERSPNIHFFPYDPAVLFGAIFLLGGLLNRKNLSFNSMLVNVVQALGGVVCLLALLGIVQRAPIALIGCSLLLLWVVSFKKARARFALGAVAAVFLLFLFHDVLQSAFDVLYEKTRVEGGAAKLVELRDLYYEVTRSTITMFLGEGWGATFENPVGPGRVRFTHSLFTFLAFKTGIIGLLLVMALFVFLLARAIPYRKFIMFDHVFLACASALLIGLFLQPTYKTFSFGLVILLMVLRVRLLKRVLMDESGLDGRGDIKFSM